MQGIDLNKELLSIKNWRIVEPLIPHASSYDTNHNSANSRKETQGNLFTQQHHHYSRNTFTNQHINSNNTVNFLGMGGSLYHGTLGAHSNDSQKYESDATPVPSFGRISARDERTSSSGHRVSEQNSKSMNKALTFSETSKFYFLTL